MFVCAYYSKILIVCAYYSKIILKCNMGQLCWHIVLTPSALSVARPAPPPKYFAWCPLNCSQFPTPI